MKTKKNTLFTAAITMIYIAAVLFYTISIAVEYKTGSDRADSRFTELTREINRNLSVNEPGSESFNNALLRSIGNVSDIAAMQLFYKDELFFSYPKDPSKTVPATSPLIIPKATTLNAENGAPVKFNAALYRLKPSSIFSKGRTAFFVVLFATIVCAVYLAYLYAYDSVYPDGKEDDFFEEDDSYNELRPVSDNSIGDSEKETEPFFEENPFTGEKAVRSADMETEEKNLEEEDEIDSEKTVADADIEETQVVEDSAATDEYWYKDEPLERESPEEDVGADPFVEATDETFEYSVEDAHVQADEEKTVDENISYTENFRDDEQDEKSFDDDLTNDMENHQRIETDVEKLSKKHKAEDNRPQGLFSPATGFGWEDYMIPRLDSELVRAASDEQDLTLFTIRIKGFDWKDEKNSEASKEVASLILETAKFKDLVFEYKKDGCSAIFQNMNIDKALVIADEVHTKIVATLSKYNLYNNVAIGISTRSLRLISGSRLANESEQALEHALEDKESPIVAFKVNPEKYRNYLASEAAKLES